MIFIELNSKDLSIAFVEFGFIFGSVSSSDFNIRFWIVGTRWSSNRRSESISGVVLVEIFRLDIGTETVEEDD
ncbi:hypothetical protein AtNW77_Chr5g0137061 [Arabidopsis thaliana]|jgi:hypothetical protein